MRRTFVEQSLESADQTNVGQPVTIPEIFYAESEAAIESIESGLYVTFLPHPSNSIPASAADEIRAGTGQCCRVGSMSLCRCGHVLGQHNSVKIPKKGGYIPPPKCNEKTCRCRQYQYSPSFPEETGQYWLKRRRDFNINEWRKVSSIDLTNRVFSFVIYSIIINSVCESAPKNTHVSDVT